MSISSTIQSIWPGFSACPESKKSSVPGHAYFNKISAFMKAHVQVGEIYLEYVKGICQRNEGI